MKKVLLALVFLAGSVNISHAQQGQGQQRSPEERVKMQTERLSERLKLTADQKTKVEAIFLGQAKSMDSLRTAGGQGGDRMEMMKKIRPIREENDKKIKALLTDDQKKAFDTYQEEMKNRMTGGRGQGGRGGQPEQKPTN